MYLLHVTNQTKKDLKRLDRPIIMIVLGILDDIAENPHAGEPLAISQPKLMGA
ncbi:MULTISPECIES: type II toxin-antitoxin system RelE family toxin [unclassified Paenibacillus]|uniref:type II toxin-antitoxin system RelE family toxin n=1 Tax=unclassified Paenibacillus TaxID=185978 RepID=UPI00363EBB1A